MDVLRSPALWIATLVALAAGYGLRVVVDVAASVDTPAVVSDARLDALTEGECPRAVDAKGDLLRTARKALEDDRSGFEDLTFSRTARPCVLEFSIPHESFYQGRVAVRSLGSTQRLDFFSRFDGALVATDRATFSVWIVRGEYAFENVHSRLFKIVRPGEVTPLR